MSSLQTFDAQTASAYSRNYYNAEDPIVSNSKITDHLKNSRFSPNFSVGNFKQIFPLGTRRIFWFGQTGLHDRPYDIHGHWISPDGAEYSQDRAKRSKDNYYSTQMKLPRRKKNVQTGQWRFELRNAQNEVLLTEFFYVGEDSGQSIVDLEEVWTDPEYDISEADTLVLLHEIQITVDENYLVRRKVHKRVKILTEDGVSQAQLYEPYIEGFESIRIGLANTILPDGQIIPMVQQLAGTISEHHPSFTSSKVVVLNFEDVVKDSILEYDITFTSTKPFTRGMFYDQPKFSNTRPVAVAQYTVTVPEDMGIRYLNVNHEVNPNVQYLEESQQNVVEWTLKNIQPIKFEPNLPPYRQLGQTVIVSSSNQWGAVAKWWLKLASRKYIFSEEMEEWLAKTVNETDAPQVKIDKLFRAVRKKFKHLPGEFGRSAYEPPPVDEIFRQQQGDSKDLSLLLQAVLKKFDIDAYITLVRTRALGELATNVTGAGEFNHVLVTAELAPDEFQFLDPSAKYYQQDVLPPKINGSELMIIKGDVIDMISLPDNMGSVANGMTVDVDASIADDLSMTGTMLIEYFGTLDGETKGRLADMDGRSFQLYIQSMVNRLYPTGRFIRCETINQKKTLKNLRMIITFSVPNAIQQQEDQYVLPIVQQRMNFPDYLSSDRETALYKDNYGFIKTSVTINLPDEFQVEQIPIGHNLDSEFLAYYTDFYSEPGTVRLDDSITEKTMNISLEDYPLYYQLYENYAFGFKQPFKLKRVTE